MKSLIAAFAVAGLLGTCLISPAVADAQLAELHLADAPVAGSYIVTVTNVRPIADLATDLRNAGIVVDREFPTLGGLSAHLTSEQVQRLRSDARVSSIEQDDYLFLDKRIIAEPTAVTSWGLDRIDQQKLPLSKSYTAPGKQGEGVHAYVLDSGIDATHPEFTGRIAEGYDAVDKDNDPTDGFGHGTHVAGTLAGTTTGVAPKATIHAVRTLDNKGNASSATILAGLEWIATNAKAPAVVNMSVGGRPKPAVEAAVKKLVAADITFVSAAGNDDRDACLDTPGRLSDVINVAATTEFDTRVWWSNWGKCVTMFAPGNEIVSTKMGGGTYAESGTSMAAPHVAGAVALYLSMHPQAKPAEIKQVLITNAVKDVRDPRGSPVRLLNVEFIGK